MSPVLPRRRGCAGPLAAVAAGSLAALYLLNLGAGTFELVPDLLPVFGNLDELGASAILLGALRYLLEPPARGPGAAAGPTSAPAAPRAAERQPARLAPPRSPR